MTAFFKKHQYYFIFQVLALVVFICFTRFSEAGLNDGDSITHFLISKYAWKYPHLFLDNWGKPFFIFFSAPFAQLGYGGIQVFNILCGTISAWFAYRIADKLGIAFAPAAPVFLFLTPVYFQNMPSGLTEILFSLVLIVSLYLLLENKNIASAIVISFLPFCRSEGYLLLPLFGLWYLSGKKIAAIPFLATGFLVYSVVGNFYYHDFLWVMHTNPYHGVDIYGHGKLTDFIAAYIPIFGNMLGILFLFGTISYITRILRRNKPWKPDPLFPFEALMVWGSLMIYFIAHSIFWYKGIFGSAGMWRVMAGIAPPFAIVCLRGISWGSSIFSWNKSFRYFIFIVLLGIIIYQPVHYFKMPTGLDERKRTVKEACNWVKTNQLDKRKIFYSEPFTKICLSLDPFDQKKSEELMYVWKGQDFGKDMPKGSIIIWEAGLGPNEDGIPVTMLLNSSDFKLLKKIEAPHEMAGKEKFAAYIFEKNK